MPKRAKHSDEESNNFIWKIIIISLQMSCLMNKQHNLGKAEHIHPTKFVTVNLRAKKESAKVCCFMTNLEFSC